MAAVGAVVLLALNPTLGEISSGVLADVLYAVSLIFATRATALATCVMEHVLADVASKSPGLGFGALSNSNAYLNTAVTGLVPRLAAFTSPYTAMGFSYSVTIGPLVDKTGVASGVSAFDVYRTVIVGVTFPGADGTSLTVNVESMVTSE